MESDILRIDDFQIFVRQMLILDMSSMTHRIEIARFSSNYKSILRVRFKTSSTLTAASMEFVKTQKGKRALYRDGFRYLKIRTNKNGTQVWLCSTKQCTAKVVLGQNDHYLYVKGEHQHAPDMFSCSDQKFKSAARDSAAATPHLGTHSIYTNVRSQFSMEINDDHVSVLPTFQSIRSSMYRAKAKNQPPLPMNLGRHCVI